MAGSEENNDEDEADDPQQQQEHEEKKKQPPPQREEFNARSVSYLLIALISLINLSSVSNIKKDTSDFRGSQSFSIAFGATTFGLSLLILIIDRTVTAVDYTKAAGGKLEGATLLFFTLLWTAALGYMSQVGGIAYVALNVYTSSWMTWALCIYTLNQWSASKDILTIAEITGISETLKSWYLLAISSMVATGSCIDFWFKTTGGIRTDDAIFGFCFSAASTFLSWGWILTHMNFLECCKEGGWMELASAWVCIMVWIVNCAVLTRDEGIGATIVGSEYRQFLRLDDTSFLDEGVDIGSTLECSFAWKIEPDQGDGSVFQGNMEGTTPIDCPFDRGIPGSNLYVASWISLAASVNIALRWNAQRALELAQPTRATSTAEKKRSKQAAKSQQRQEPASPRAPDEAALSVDDDDFDDFIDADAY